jgi:hypothetical protein
LLAVATQDVPLPSITYRSIEVDASDVVDRRKRLAMILSGILRRELRASEEE